MANSIWGSTTGRNTKPVYTKPKPKPVVKTTTAKKPAPVNPLSPVNFDLYRTQSATVQDLSKKWGIDYSREYAARQAEAAAQAKRSGLQNQQKQIDVGVRNAQDALDRSFFQQGLQSAQAGVNNGVNAGLANEANLRLGMNRQAEMAGIFRESQVEKNKIAEQLTATETERLAMEEQLYQERLAQAFEQSAQLRQLDQSEKQALMQAALEQRRMNIDMNQFGQQLAWDKSKFGQEMAWNKSQFSQQMDWNRFQFNNLSASDQASNKLAWAQLQEEKRQFGSEMAWRKHEFNNMSASQKAELNQAKDEFEKEMWWRQYEMEKTQEHALAIAEAEYGGGSFLEP
jgi:hypothetical protein